MSNFKPDNISYINKDFQSIYEELLELVPKLTNKWDPSLSNESDPLVVLLKLNALLADKNNYNIDKNILELYPVSVTQRGNAQKIYESLGYNMRWYESALTEVYLRWTGKTGVNDGSITLSSGEDPFISITDDSGEIVYTIIPTEETGDIYTLKTTRSDLKLYALQGVVHTYDINGDTNITLQNLDSNLRLYFTESQIAENGIFIKSSSDKWWSWSRVDNLESTQLDRKVYKFGVLPNTNTCYIEFPQDIANLIGQGLTIKYLISSGEQGTIPAGTLNSLSNNIELTIDGEKQIVNDSIKIWNPDNSTEGKDPESLDDAYNNYLKVVNTFNTLVTCKDYENAIYRLRDKKGLPLISNVVVSDRTNDINSTIKIQSLTSSGDKVEYKVDPGNPMDPYDLRFYLLNYSPNILNATQYDNTFKGGIEIQSVVEQELEDYKAIQHDITNPWSGSSSDPYIFKNKYSINCQLTTYNKVSDKEAKDIEDNVTLALYKNFNSREVNFGEPIDYDYLIEVIQSADKRIKNVILGDLDYSTYYLTNDGEDHLLGNNTTDILAKSILAKNIVAGVTQGIEFDTTFNYEFNQVGAQIYPSPGTDNQIKSITTQTAVEVPSSGEYDLKPNESVVFYTPNLIPQVTYANYLYYQTETPFGADTKEGDYFSADSPIYFYKYRSGSEGNYSYSELVATIQPGTIINLSGFGDLGVNGAPLQGSLGSNKTITTYSTNVKSIPFINNYIKCYWVLNNPQNELELNNNKLFLNNGEYFLYSNETQTEVYILGSGTIIDFGATAPQQLKENGNLFPTDIVAQSIPDIESVNELSISEINWVNLYTPEDVTVTENKIIVLAGDATLQGAALDIKAVNDGLNASEVPPDLKYKGSTDKDFISLPNSPGGWKAFSFINLVGSKEEPLPLYPNQKLILNYTNNTTRTPDPTTSTITGKDNFYVQFNTPIALPGGEDVDVGILDSSLTPQYTLELYAYKVSEEVERVGEYISKDLKSGNSYSVSLPFTDYIVPFIWQGNKIGTSNTLTPLSIAGANNFITGSSFGNITGDSGRAMYLTPTSTTTPITFAIPDSTTGGSGSLLIGKPFKISNLNNKDIIINFLSKYNKSLFNYTYEVPEYRLVKNPLEPESFFNPNHVMNRFTIAQINTDDLKIRVANSSRL